ncbi:MAG TPA: hypothetical protein VLA36_12490 [Longimicrobiales bacterium]|nr:hypothetical protein [Longimicrobiales bacterium]
MSVVLWGVLALAAGLAAMVVVGRWGVNRSGPLPAGVELPATPLQRISWWGLGVGAALGAAAAGVVLVHGVQQTYDNDHVRMFFTLLLLGVLIVFAVVSALVKSWAARRDGKLDERDREILGRAPAIQSAATLVTLAVWMVGLIERFHDVGMVPLFYLYLIFWSCVVVNLLGLPVGVLLGYRRG